jgi:ABC-2 type transport system permease protein
MSTHSNAIPDAFEGRQVAAAPLAPTRPFYWSVRRELWEYRSIYIAPLVGAAVTLVGFFIFLPHLPEALRNSLAPNAAPERHSGISHPFEIGMALVMGASFLVSIFYALDTIYGERRDRSILFWKSMPVSDLTAVLAKFTVTMVVIPLVSFAITIATEAVLIAIGSVVLAASGLSPAAMWSALQPVSSGGHLLYHLVTVHMIWYAPLYAWLMLISAWSRRAPFLWAAMPILAITLFEKMAFHTSYILGFLQSRVSGGNTMDAMSADNPVHAGAHMTPLAFLATPGLWFGLAFAALFLFAAARLRRSRNPS